MRYVRRNVNRSVAPYFTQTGDIAQHQRASRQARDADQLRAIHQGMVLWAQNNADVYPLPSRLDTADNTVPEPQPISAMVAAPPRYAAASASSAS